MRENRRNLVSVNHPSLWPIIHVENFGMMTRAKNERKREFQVRKHMHSHPEPVCVELVPDSTSLNPTFIQTSKKASHTHVGVKALANTRIPSTHAIHTRHSFHHHHQQQQPLPQETDTQK